MSEWDKKLLECINVLYTLNDYGDKGVTAIIKTNGDFISIEFMGFMLWNNFEDKREFKNGKYEPLKPYVIKQYNDLIDSISKQKIEVTKE